MFFSFRVHTGRVYLGATNRSFADQEMSIDSIISHPKWDFSTVRNDIALIKLPRSAKINSNLIKFLA